MFGIQNYTSFILAIVVFQLIPGPGTLTILKATARHGVRAGMEAVLGTLAGDFLLMLAAVLGLAAVLAAHPLVLTSLQWVGIAYLVWLGLKLLRTADAPTESGPATRGNYIQQAFAVCMTNPKASLFFLAFFPLFLKPGARASTLAAMMAHVTILSLLYQATLVMVGNAIAIRLARNKHIRVLAKRLAGVALIGFGLKLAANDR
jgi:threonine/homoserine/homoserine lactone efflux protein